MGVDSPGSWVTLRSMIPRGDFYKKFEQLCKILTKIGNILTHFSVAQAGVNYEKKLKNRSKILFKYIRSRKVIWLARAWYLKQIDSAQFYTPWRFRKVPITRLEWWNNGGRKRKISLNCPCTCIYNYELK